MTDDEDIKIEINIFKSDIEGSGEETGIRLDGEETEFKMSSTNSWVNYIFRKMRIRTPWREHQ